MKAACSGPVGKGITIVIEVKGKFNTALCYTPALDGKAEEQICLVCDEEAGQQNPHHAGRSRGKRLYHRDDHDHYG